MAASISFRPLLAGSNTLAYVQHMPTKRTSGRVATIEQIERSIQVIRGQRVMLDADLAKLYGVPTHRLNEQVSRKRNRFPDDFAYQLSQQEFTALISQFAISKTGRGGRRKRPWVFTNRALRCYRACSIRRLRFA